MRDEGNSEATKMSIEMNVEQKIWRDWEIDKQNRESH